MLRYYLTVAVLSCMALGAPQHRFAMPSQFSFRTVHVPSTLPSFQKSARLTGPETTQEVSHIPVMVSVPNDFVGDSVVVTSEDLNNMGLSSVKTAEETPVVEEVQPEITVQEEMQPEITPAEEIVPEVPVVEEIQPEITAKEVVEIIPEESAAPLTQADEAFILTTSEPELVNEPVVVEEMPVETPVQEEAPIEFVPEVQEIVEEPIKPVVAPVQETAINPLDTPTFKAYNDFLNTWLQLASVNLNRPDLLNLRHIPVSPAVQQVVPVEIAPEPIQEIIPEPVVEEIIPEPIVEEIVSEPVVEEVIPEMVIEPVVESNPEPVITEEIIEVVTEVAPEAVAEEIVTEAIPEEIPATDVLSEPELVTESVPSITEPEPVIAEQEPMVTKPETPAVSESQVLPELTPEIISTNSIAKSISSGGVPTTNTLIRQIPRITSRGRFSGYTYSFSHVPQTGTYFLHPVIV